jgi:hypothetical protein
MLMKRIFGKYAVKMIIPFLCDAMWVFQKKGPSASEKLLMPSSM